MHRTENKKPTGDGNPTAGHTDGDIVLNTAQRIKATLIRYASWLALIFRGVA